MSSGKLTVIYEHHVRREGDKGDKASVLLIVGFIADLDREDSVRYSELPNRIKIMGPSDRDAAYAFAQGLVELALKNGIEARFFDVVDD